MDLALQRHGMAQIRAKEIVSQGNLAFANSQRRTHNPAALQMAFGKEESA